MSLLRRWRESAIDRQLYDELNRFADIWDKASPAVMRSFSEQLVRKLAKISAETENFTSEGKFDLGCELTKRGIVSVNSDIAGGSSTWICGAILLSQNMKESVNQYTVMRAVTDIANQALLAVVADKEL